MTVFNWLEASYDLARLVLKAVGVEGRQQPMRNCHLAVSRLQVVRHFGRMGLTTLALETAIQNTLLSFIKDRGGLLREYRGC